MIKKVADSKYTMVFLGFISTIMLVIITAIVTDGLADIKKTINQTVLNTYQLTLCTKQLDKNTICIKQHDVKLTKIEDKIFYNGDY